MIHLQKLWGDYLVESTLKDIFFTISEYNKKNNKKKYNIFKVLEITDREVLMCRVLADFLNPEGSHEKGSKYLKIFLNKVIHRDDYETICTSAHVFKEYPITGERRIDIVIESKDIFIPIEVKIHAVEQKAQCYDYYMYAAKKDSAPKVVYLTKWGTVPSEYSLSSASEGRILPIEKVLCISFAEDICHFMEMIIENEDDWIIQEVARQYREAIKEFTVFVDEELQMEVASKLCESEQNFRSMLVIEKAANNAKAKLIYSLFEEFEEQFLSIQNKYGLKRESRFNWYEYKSQATEKYYAQKESTYPGLNYVFSDISLPSGIELWFRIEIDHNLFAGLCLFDINRKSEFRKENQYDKSFQEIEKVLNKYINSEHTQYENWWIQWWYLPTAYDNKKLEECKIPNFKDMNEAAIVLANKNTRKCFVKECLSVIDSELNKILQVKLQK